MIAGIEIEIADASESEEMDDDDSGFVLNIVSSSARPAAAARARPTYQERRGHGPKGGPKKPAPASTTATEAEGGEGGGGGSTGGGGGFGCVPARWGKSRALTGVFIPYVDTCRGQEMGTGGDCGWKGWGKGAEKRRGVGWILVLVLLHILSFVLKCGGALAALAAAVTVAMDVLVAMTMGLAAADTRVDPLPVVCPALESLRFPVVGRVPLSVPRCASPLFRWCGKPALDAPTAGWRLP